MFKNNNYIMIDQTGTQLLIWIWSDVMHSILLFPHPLYNTIIIKVTIVLIVCTMNVYIV